MVALRNADLFQPHRRPESLFFRSILDITDYLRQAIQGEGDPFGIVQILKSALNTPAFALYAETVAKNMVTMLQRDNARSWREAARESSRGRLIYEALRQELNGPAGGEFYHQIARNAELIKTLPQDIAQHVTDYIGEESLKGRRAEDIAADIQKMFPASSRAKAQLIARTEVSKVSTALTQARAQNLGMDWYEWITSEDQRVRPSHHKMQGVLIRWSDPPAPEALIGIRSTLGHYNSGECPNCRCFPAPLTDVDRVSWPHKCYINGQILMLAKSRFLQIAA
jgi:SPP1 gp7 family putative phage head morphogenesis protein